jgi:hypothetical protein
MPVSDTIANAMIDHLTGKAVWSAPAAFFVGLSSTTPTTAGGNVTEPSGGGYARKQISAAQFAAAAARASENNEEISFDPASGTWVLGVNLTHFVFYSASSGGTFLGFCALAVPKPFFAGDTPVIADGALDIEVGV